jgi:opacity protein-like surface antigen
MTHRLAPLVPSAIVVIALAGVAMAVAALSAAAAEDFNRNQICRAAIATIMSRSPNIIKIEGTGDDGVIYLWYVRWNDQTRWDYKCKVEGERILWGALQGRWQTEPRDAVVTYAVKDGLLEIEEKRATGHTRTRHYTRKQFVHH